jgi:hypothetical protein
MIISRYVRKRTERNDWQDDNFIAGIHQFNDVTRSREMTLGTVLLIVLVLALLGVIPTWPHSKGWGYGPSGVVGLLVVILIVLLVMGRI